MKTILLACNSSNMGGALRRSLEHLVKSCPVEIVHDGFQVFDELSRKAFDLIIIDFEIAHVDSLELVESIQYIDPGVPVILMLRQEHVLVWNTARHLRAELIIRPFKPLAFLRLVDRLLHRQLNRYRELASMLQASLEMFRRQAGGVCALLVDESGQVLIASGEIEALAPDELGAYLAEDRLPGEGDGKGGAAIIAPGRCPGMQTYGLYLTPVLTGLRLALIASPLASATRAAEIWNEADRAANQLKSALYRQTPVLAAAEKDGADRPLAHRFISLHLSPAPDSFDVRPAPFEADLPAEEGTIEAAVNWAILTDTPGLLGRLRDFCQLS